MQDLPIRPFAQVGFHPGPNCHANQIPFLTSQVMPLSRHLKHAELNLASFGLGLSQSDRHIGGFSGQGFLHQVKKCI